jgi:hypothetical protein
MLDAWLGAEEVHLFINMKQKQHPNIEVNFLRALKCKYLIKDA